MRLAKNGIGLFLFSFLLFSVLVHDGASAPDNVCTPKFTDTSPGNLKIFDAHVHVTSDYTSDFVISEMDQAGVSMALLYPDNDARSLNYIAQYPGRFSTFVAFPDNPPWLDGGQQFIDHVKTQLDTGRFTGIGEINLRYYNGASYTPPPDIYVQPDTPLMLQVVNLSAIYRVPISFHFVPDDPVANAALERMFSYNENATFIWSHLGFNNMPLNADTLDYYLMRYPNLYLDTAGIQNMMNDPGALNSNWRGVFVNQTDGRLNARWKEFFETWNSRILWATDAGGGNDPKRWFNYANNTVQDAPPNAVGRWRSALATLDSNAVRNVFSANARAVILKEARPAYDYSVASNGKCFPVTVNSNSSVSALDFDQATNTITFKTADSSGTTGSAAVSIPTGLLNGTFTVQVNGHNVQFGETISPAYANLRITYGGGVNLIAVTATPSVNPTSQNPSPTPQPTATAAPTVAATNQATAIASVNPNTQANGFGWVPIVGVVAVIAVIAAVYFVTRKPPNRR
ncbi:Amidohydrolase [Candidatus Norongarragalina meridionalis]|nr:Amidohydrolase [Candidatus Norongarragalina meridionalis]